MIEVNSSSIDLPQSSWTGSKEFTSRRSRWYEKLGRRKMKVKLSDVVKNAETLEWDKSLYIPFKPDWSVDMQIMILDQDDTEDIDLDPKEAIENNLRYGLSISTVQDVVENALSQDPKASIETLIDALKYYFDNDAFIELEIVESN